MSKNRNSFKVIFLKSAFLVRKTISRAVFWWIWPGYLFHKDPYKQVLLYFIWMMGERKHIFGSCSARDSFWKWACALSARLAFSVRRLIDHYSSVMLCFVFCFICLILAFKICQILRQNCSTIFRACLFLLFIICFLLFFAWY